MRIDEGFYLVRFLEMSFNDIHIGDRNNIKWPETIDDLATPRMDGAITLYDVTNQESLARVPEMLSQYNSRTWPWQMQGANRLARCVVEDRVAIRSCCVQM